MAKNLELDMTGFQRAGTPERDLWAHVMRQAVDDALWPNGKISKAANERVSIQEKRSNRTAARKWFKSTADYVGSFSFICLHLNMDRDSTRTTVITLIGVEPKGEPELPPPPAKYVKKPIRVRPCDECHKDYQYQREGSRFCHRCKLIPPGKRAGGNFFNGA